MAEITVGEKVLKANDQRAAANQRRLDERGILGINLMSAPGSGKTTLLETTIRALEPDRCAVLVGDLQTTRDADRLARFSSAVVQINTGRGCHLTAEQVSEGLDHLDLDRVRYLFIENVGNMVCPAGFALGEHRKVVALSLPEGDDKAAKYPTLFQCADAVLLTKIDLAGLLAFDESRVTGDLALLNTRAPLLRLSSRTGAGMDAWLAWLRAERRAIDGKR